MAGSSEATENTGDLGARHFFRHMFILIISHLLHSYLMSNVQGVSECFKGWY